MSKIYNPSGGFRKLHSFNFATIIHLGTISFCKRSLPWKDDPLGKTFGQMIGASRSGKQNIIEGSERAKTSSETEIKLTDVAKASLNELQGDLEDYLVQKGSIPWSIRNADHQAVLSIMLDEFDHTEDLLHDYWTYLLRQKKKLDPWLEDRDDITAANALIVLIQRATGLLGRQLTKLESAFIESGGIREKMTAARLEARAEPAAPMCPECGTSMKKRTSTRGSFWGCGAYPKCKGVRQIESEVKTTPRLRDTGRQEVTGSRRQASTSKGDSDMQTKRFMFAIGLAGSLGLSAHGEPAKLAEKQSPADFHVAVSGKDGNPGTAAAPFATLAKAREAVREKIKAGLTKDILVEIHGVTYPVTETLTFGPEDSGTEKFLITYAAAPGEKVVLNGGRAITGWKKGTNEVWTAEIPEVKAGKWYPRQLFVNGRRAIRARMPNADDQTPWWKIRGGDLTTMGVTGPIKAYRNPGDVELVYIENNEGGRKRLESISEPEQQFTLAPPHRWNPGCFSYDAELSKPKAGKACYLENALELLDQAGEWYLDRQTGLLSYWPRPGEDLNRDEIVAPVLQNTLLAVAGTKERPVLNLHFRGLHVEHVDWPLPAWGYMGLFCCNVSDGDAGHRFIDAAVEYQQARQCSFTGGGIAHAGAMGLCLRKGTASIVVEGNEIQDLGGGGIGMGYPNVAAGYLYAAPPPDPGEYRDYHVANNYVHHCGETYYGAVGITLMASQDSVVAHNLIHDTAYFGIGVAGSQDPKVPFARNNRIEYNHIYHAMKVTVDGAGMYVTFAQADQGCLIRGNVVHDQVVNHFNSRPVGGYSAAGIYLDIANSGCRYEQNVVYRTPSTMYLGGGWRIEATWWRENVFLKTGAPPREFLDAVHARAGLEPAYRRALLKTDTVVCDLHDLTPAGADAAGWTASQFNMPKAGQGVVQVFRGMAGEEVAMQLKLRDLDAAATYLIASFVGPLDRQFKADAHGVPPELSYVDPIMGGPDQGSLSPDGGLRLTGRELMDAGLPVKLTKGPHVSWTVYRILSAVVTTDTPRGKAPLPVRFDGTQSACTSGKIVSYDWDFGDGATGRESVTAHTYKQRGTYTARLTVKNEQGRSAVDEVTITVKPMDAVAPLFARWKLDDGKGLVAADASTNKLDGALKGAPVWTNLAGRAGLSFDGVDDIVEMSNRLETLAVPFTFAFWVNPAAEQVEYADILGNHDHYRGLVMQQDGRKTNLFAFGYGDGAQGYGPGSVQLTAAAWQHVAVVCDGEKAFCYINGEEKGKVSSRGAFAPNHDLTFRLGQGYGSGRFFRGLLSDVRIYREALTAAEVRAVMKE